ncbi:citrate/2-methylcitrate synthase [Leifsonia shinshuensis]|uniref:citrate synthase (unknown stereospecificity) n=1 Tax=Leifsonia shinshuensis TaxID=150026 RepID=A0A853CUS8_9MICO|nr:citrate/2-methylcitrate synthase [Leifsonia shinshuensis]NYJ23663.1 citrate synthase [Leifsonia shinshuensis]
MSDLPRLTAEQTAERLGVKLETLYAYVARGLLDRERTAGGSTFDPLEVEAFASARRRRASPAPVRSEGRPLMVIETDFALIDDGQLYYRGRPAAELAGEPFEVVARWALTGRWEPSARFAAGPGLEDARRVAEALPAGAGDRDRQLVAVTALAAADPLRTSLDPEAVAGAAERLIAGMVAVLPERSPATAAGDGAEVRSDTTAALAAELWARLSPQPATAEALRTLNAALVLLLDHDLAVSTLAARAAASARATPYAVVVAGLGALDSPLHGNASRAAHRMLARIAAGEEPARVVSDAVVDGRGPVPGFGQPLYPAGDPRGRVLLGMLADIPGAAPVVAAVDALAALLRERTGAAPNVDLALAALSLAGGMADDAGEVVFATARTAGWVVHALAEYREPPLRLRPVGRYSPRA